MCFHKIKIWSLTYIKLGVRLKIEKKGECIDVKINYLLFFNNVVLSCFAIAFKLSHDD
jgi:hypothetical protein